MYLTLHLILQEKRQMVSTFSDEKFGVYKDHLALPEALEDLASASLSVLIPATLPFLWPCWTICVSLSTAGGRLPSSLHIGCSFDLECSLPPPTTYPFCNQHLLIITQSKILFCPSSMLPQHPVHASVIAFSMLLITSSLSSQFDYKFFGLGTPT